jgi:Ca2+-binding RTX toxin-like protein
MRPLLLALLLLLTGAAPANAAVTHRVVDNTLTVTGDDADNAITLTVRAGELAVNEEETGLAANRNATIVIDGLAGADIADAGVLTAADYAALTFTGGPGDDSLTGGDESDLLVWNEGDGSDFVEGGNGNDGVDVNGSPVAETFTFGPERDTIGGVVLSRTAPAPFTIAFQAERMSVNLFAGDDVIAPIPGTSIAARTEPILTGGQGEDQMTGGDGIDQIHGGQDTDLLRGGRGSNTLFGEEGPDRLEGGIDEDFLIGGRGNDRVTGEGGADFLLWTDGDGDDIASGGPGNDDLAVDGSPNADTFSYERDPGTPGGFLFRGAGPVPFTLEFDAESLTINGNNGNDTLTPNRLTGLRTFTDGGPGDDRLEGGDGIDTIHGGEGFDDVFGGPGTDQVFGEGGRDLVTGGSGNDNLLGGEGDDSLIGNGGEDTHLGNDGNDSVVWFDGDGSDLVLGEAGLDHLTVEGSVAGSDHFELVAELGTTTFRRTNLTPFAIDLPNIAVPGTDRSGGFETVEVIGVGGDDTFTVSPGLAHLRVSADGGPGNDQLRGAAEADQFLGGPGNDTLVPGAGEDLADGQQGEDVLSTRDGAVDVVRGGPDRDSAQTDLPTVDVVVEVEDLDADQPPPPPPPVQPPPPPIADNVALLPKLGRAVIAKNGKKLAVKIPLSCPAEEAGGCRTTLTVKAARPGTTLGSKRLQLAAGAKSTATIQAPRAATVARNGKLPVRIRVATTDAAGNTATGIVAAVLKLPR